MSEQASQFLSSIGLLGEYCPFPREKEKTSVSEVGCMQLEPRQGYGIHHQVVTQLYISTRTKWLCKIGAGNKMMPSTGFSNEVEKAKYHIAATVEEEGSKPLLLHAVEAFCGKARPEAVKEVGLVLNILYQHDLLEEDFIVEWYEKGLHGGNKGSPIWKYVKPFVEWLQNAEPEEE
ncbi:UNVERIFIED_CONTAM: Eukaryotic translation initiation factor 5 [Sesamum latifolium]|uniref:Eukaryotic translation initiation factor 5 n=1 Tax=Sesamum latifolium TaxID=2727402 RepID=A0AAW2VTJ8_9LAMI